MDRNALIALLEEKQDEETLGRTHEAIELYKQRLAAAPDDISEYRCLAHAYLAAGEYEEAGKVVEAGLELGQDVRLPEQQGSVLAGRGHPEDALATWERVFELDGERISACYSRAFLHERGYDIQAEWPERELARLQAAVSE